MQQSRGTTGDRGFILSHVTLARANDLGFQSPDDGVNLKSHQDPTIESLFRDLNLYWITSRQLDRLPPERAA